jgi:hypothetical protein
VADWVRWHGAYEDPESPLSRRLSIVVDFLGRALEASPRLAPVVLSLCAGEGRDVVDALACSDRVAAKAVLVELDGALADRARARAAAAGLRTVEVRRADAGRFSSFSDVAPVDVLLLCGVFGNMEHAEVRPLIGLVPRLVTSGGHVVWTRGASEPDRRGEVRAWFADAGMQEIDFVGAPEPFGVGLNKTGRPRRRETTVVPEQLFRFVERA